MNEPQYDQIGKRPVRADASDKVTGKAKFGADLFLPGMLIGKVLRSPHAHARILGIDTSRALALDGVEAVVTAADFPPYPKGPAGDTSRDNLAEDKVLYHGHGVAAVAATSEVIACEALELIDVRYEVLPPVMSIDAALAADAPLLHEDLRPAGADESEPPSNIAMRTELKKGDVDEGFKQADVIVEREFSSPTVHQGYVEPASCVASYDGDGQSLIWTSTQGHFVVRDSVARMLKLDSSQIKVVAAEIGGGFGGKLSLYLDAIALLLSRQAGRPVKMAMSRAEVFLAGGPGAGTKMRVKVGATKDGKITAAEAWLAYEAGAFIGGPVGGGLRNMFTSYDIEHVDLEGITVVLNKPKVRAYRGPGAPQGILGSETVLNELAAKLEMDPIEFRLKNAVTEGTTAITGQTFGPVGLVECLTAARESDHYRSALGANQGRGLAVGYWGGGGGPSSANVSLNNDGTAAVVTGSVDLSGTRTTMAMMAAETLGLPVEKVSTHVADTDAVGFTGMSGGSRTVNATGMAVKQAADAVVEEVRQRAASGWNVTAEQVEWDKGVARNSATREELTIAEIARAAARTGGPIAKQSSVNAPGGRGPGFAVHICDVEVDPDTGHTQVVRYTAIQDAGKAIHPSQVEGQMQGGAVQGIGWALNEEYVYSEDGVLENPSFLDYRMPLTLDLPMIETIIVEVPNAAHPFGVRGVGEPPIIPPLAAVASAVGDAIGVPFTHLPCSPPNVLKAILKQGSSSGSVTPRYR